MTKKTDQKVCIIGMGYVGLPLAAVCAKNGYTVTGFDLDEEKLAIIRQGKSPFFEKFLDDLLPQAKMTVTSKSEEIAGNDIYVICVPTPVDGKHNPDIRFVADASTTVAQNMSKGALVILESTVNPGVSEEVVKPIFEKAGFVVGKDVFISHCPERVNPGDEKWNVTNLPRVVGSFDEEGLKRTVEFYKNVTTGDIVSMDNIREAEATKIMENSFRDINIAFVNELAMSFAKLDIDITNVIRGASSKFSFMPHWPGCGVGGHCIPVDPYYMIEKGKENDFDHKFLSAARRINDGMADYTVEMLQDRLNDVSMAVKGTRVGVLGISYKANIGDLRESPALRIMSKIKKMGADMLTFDPYVPKLSSEKTLADILSKSQALVITTEHNEFKNIPVEDFVKHGIKVIIDGRNCLDKKAIRAAGIIYSGIGR